MDEMERRNRWRGMTVPERHDALFGAKPPAPQSVSAPSLASLVHAGPPRSSQEQEEIVHQRRAVRARFQIEAELERERQEAQQARQAEHAAFRQTTALGQLMRS
jgi:hypothetical protein